MGGMKGGGEGGGLVCKEKNKEASQYFKFFCSCTHPTQLPEVPNPFMDDDGAVVISIFPHQSSNPQNTKFFFVFIKLKFMTFTICIIIEW